MKWENRGHELDTRAEELLSKINTQEKLYVFGAGMLGEDVYGILNRLNMFAGFIDNNTEKQKNGMDGMPVLSLEEYLAEGKKNLIVIAATRENTAIISKQLTDAALEAGKDFYTYRELLYEILPILLLYAEDKLYVDLAQICVTERCTLKCEKCAHACFNVSHDTEDMEKEEVFKSADAFFDKVELCREFVLIGGEPLLYKNLAEAIAYIGSRYRERMVNFCITTNGTLLPSREVLEQCRAQRVLFRISNYVRELPWLSEKHMQLTSLLEENNIAYSLGKPELEWTDYGFDSEYHLDKEETLCQVFDECKTPCREIRGSKYYFCVKARSVSDNLKMHIGQEDYLDLEALTGTDYKKALLEFQLGYSDKGYLDMCRYCRGSEAYRYPVPAAKQITREA